MIAPNSQKGIQQAIKNKIHLSVENSLIKARSLSKKGNVSEGINILQSILKNFPNNMRVQRALQNLTSSHVNFTDEAIPDLELKNLFELFKSIETKKFLFEADKTLRLYPNSRVNLFNINF